MSRTSSVIVDHDAAYKIIHGSAAWAAACEWVRFHGLNPNRIPADSVIYRQPAQCRIVYSEFAFDGAHLRLVDGEPVVVDRVEQGEAPPLPLPPEVLALVPIGRTMEGRA